jgi:hypothetical protein
MSVSSVYARHLQLLLQNASVKRTPYAVTTLIYNATEHVYSNLTIAYSRLELYLTVITVGIK